MLQTGFHNFGINFNVIFASTTAEAMASDLAAHLRLRLWQSGHSLNCPPDQSPMRVVRFHGAPWSAAYPVDRAETVKLKRLFTVRGMLEYTLGTDWDYVHVANSDTSGIATLREYRMGMGRREMVANGNPNFNDLNADVFADSDFATLEDIQHRTAELGLFQGNFDGGARDAAGCIWPFEEIEPHHQAVAEQFLLV